MFGQHLMQISSKSQMFELESVRKFVELTRNNPTEEFHSADFCNHNTQLALSIKQHTENHVQ